ncbi:hypothetical protein IE077_001785, partial [Cardiosporidium cionae]
SCAILFSLRYTLPDFKIVVSSRQVSRFPDILLALAILPEYQIFLSRSAAAEWLLSFRNNMSILFALQDRFNSSSIWFDVGYMNYWMNAHCFGKCQFHIHGSLPLLHSAFLRDVPLPPDGFSWDDQGSFDDEQVPLLLFTLSAEGHCCRALPFPERRGQVRARCPGKYPGLGDDRMFELIPISSFLYRFRCWMILSSISHVRIQQACSSCSSPGSPYRSNTFSHNDGFNPSMKYAIASVSATSTHFSRACSNFRI